MDDSPDLRFQHVHCPCCNKPLEAKCCRWWQSQHDRGSNNCGEGEKQPANVGRCAYVICLWGKGLAYVLGGAVLGQSILETGTPHELLCLCTSNVPKEPYRALLEAAGWRVKEVGCVEAAPRLFFLWRRKGHASDMFSPSSMQWGRQNMRKCCCLTLTHW